MIGWTRLVLATAWVMSASLACATATPAASAPDSVRSPALDYGEGPRSADDGEVLGAQRESTQDWLSSATTSHLGPGWSLRDGQPHFDREQVRARASAGRALPACPPSRAPLAPDEVEVHAALLRAWLEAAREPALPAVASASVDLPDARSGFLSCDGR